LERYSIDIIYINKMHYKKNDGMKFQAYWYNDESMIVIQSYNDMTTEKFRTDLSGLKKRAIYSTVEEDDEQIVLE